LNFVDALCGCEEDGGVWQKRQEQPKIQALAKDHSESGVTDQERVRPNEKML